MSDRIALIIGIDDYGPHSLSGCVADSEAVASLLRRNADDTANFQCKVLAAGPTSVNRATLRKEITDLFSKGDVDMALLYFAGHGSFNRTGGILVSQDAQDGDEGLPMAEVVGLANRSAARERVIVLDCCHSGSIDELATSVGTVPLEEGTAFLLACRSNEAAVERGGRGLFTSQMCEALSGGAADVRGNVTIASAYSYVNEVFTSWEQRPLFRASLSRVSALRRAEPSVSDAKLREMHRLFPALDYEFRLDPSFEPTAEPRSMENEATFAVLQQLRGARLIEPVGNPHMYFAAMDSLPCRMTPLGQFFWKAVEADKI